MHVLEDVSMACADCQCKRHAELEALRHQSAALLSIRPTPELVWKSEETTKGELE